MVTVGRVLAAIPWVTLLSQHCSCCPPQGWQWPGHNQDTGATAGLGARLLLALPHGTSQKKTHYCFSIIFCAGPAASSFEAFSAPLYLPQPAAISTCVVKNCRKVPTRLRHPPGPGRGSQQWLLAKVA